MGDALGVENCKEDPYCLELATTEWHKMDADDDGLVDEGELNEYLRMYA